MNFTDREKRNIVWLANEKKLEVKLYKQNTLFSVYVLEKFYCAYHDPLSIALLEDNKAKSNAIDIANKFIKWLDEQKDDIYNNGYNVKVIYVNLDK